MYVVLSAIAIENVAQSQWVAIDPATAIVTTAFSIYRDIVVTVTKDGETYFVSMNQLRSDYATYTNTITILFQSIGNRALENIPALPSGKVKYIKYSDAYLAKYTVNKTKIGENYPESMPASELTDLVIKRPSYETELSLIHKYCMVSINGMYHMTDTDGESAFIVDGGKSVSICSHNHVGIMSFLDIGELTKTPITVSMISKRNDQESLIDRVVLTLPESQEGKVTLLSLGGFLVMPEDGVFYQVSDRTFEIDLNRLPYLARLFESKRYIDLSSLQLSVDSSSPNAINANEAKSDRVITAYLTLPQSFVVTVNTPEIFTNRIYIAKSNTPGSFTAYQEPVYPLFTSLGKSQEYWKVKEDGYWAVTVVDSYERNYVFDTLPSNQLENVTNAMRCDRPVYLNHGFLLEIGAYF